MRRVRDSKDSVNRVNSVNRGVVVASDRDTILLLPPYRRRFPNKKGAYLSPFKKSFKIVSASSPLNSLTFTLGVGL